MVVQNRLRFIEVVREVWRPLALLLVLDLGVTVAYVGLGWTWITPSNIPLPLLGTGLAVFLGLRNNTAYARWWEARTLWGSVTNQSRNLARSLSSVMTNPESEAIRRRIIRHQIAWVHALRCMLRRDDVLGKLEPYLTTEEVARVAPAGNIAFAIQTEIATMIGIELRDGRIDSIETIGLNTILNALTDAQGGLERIRNTPMPRQYSTFSRIFVTLYCILLPFGIVPDLNILTPIGSGVIGFLFLTLDMSGRHLEDPFARSAHDIPMSAITRTIEIDLEHSLGQENLPSPVRPVFGVLR